MTKTPRTSPRFQTREYLESLNRNPALLNARLMASRDKSKRSMKSSVVLEVQESQMAWLKSRIPEWTTFNPKKHLVTEDCSEEEYSDESVDAVDDDDEDEEEYEELEQNEEGDEKEDEPITSQMRQILELKFPQPVTIIDTRVRYRGIVINHFTRWDKHRHMRVQCTRLFFPARSAEYVYSTAHLAALFSKRQMVHGSKNITSKEVDRVYQHLERVLKRKEARQKMNEESGHSTPSTEASMTGLLSHIPSESEDHADTGSSLILGEPSLEPANQCVGIGALVSEEEASQRDIDLLQTLSPPVECLDPVPPPVVQFTRDLARPLVRTGPLKETVQTEATPRPHEVERVLAVRQIHDKLEFKLSWKSEAHEGTGERNEFVDTWHSDQQVTDWLEGDLVLMSQMQTLRFKFNQGERDQFRLSWRPEWTIGTIPKEGTDLGIGPARRDAVTEELYCPVTDKERIVAFSCGTALGRDTKD